MALNLNDYFDEEEEKLANGQQPVEEQKKEKESVSVDEDDDAADYIEPRSARRKRRIRLVGFAAILLIIVFALVKGFLIGKSVEDGSMKAFVVKIEKKGLFFDSYECIVIQAGDSSATQISTTDLVVGRRLHQLVGSDSMAIISNTKYKTAYPWRGETRVIVDSVSAKAMDKQALANLKPVVYRDTIKIESEKK